MLILLSGLMIGSTLFAVPKKRKAGNNNPRLTGEELVMMFRWFYAQPTERAEAEYYRLMKRKPYGAYRLKGVMSVLWHLRNMLLISRSKRGFPKRFFPCKALSAR